MNGRRVAAFLLCLPAIGATADCVAMNGDAKPIVLTDADNGKTCELATGEKLEVRLEAQLGTGYSWRPQKPDERVLQPLGERSIEAPREPKLGGKELQVFRYEAKAAGEVTLLFEYVRPWEKDVPPARTFRASVRVSARPAK
jgi:inhibitor of cysteine peptidase